MGRVIEWAKVHAGGRKDNIQVYPYLFLTLKNRVDKITPLYFMKTLFQGLFILLCLIFLSAPVYAQERTGDMAVLDIQFSGKAPTVLNLGFLARKIREAAVKYTYYRVMTEENIFAIIEDKKIDLSKCKEAECVVEYGRMLQADKLVSSTLTYSGDTYFFIIELYDIRTAAIERSVSKQCKGCEFAGLLEMVNKAARELFTGEVTEAEPLRKQEYGSLHIESTPPGALIYIDGKQIAEMTPADIANVPVGKRKIVLERGEYSEEREVLVRLNEQTDLKVSIKERGKGNLAVESTPEGATIFIDGKEMGKTPMIVKNIEVGTHAITLKKSGYVDATETRPVIRGSIEKVMILMGKKVAIGCTDYQIVST